jgi:hypothetical protein
LSDSPKGRPIAIDPDAISSRPGEPAFIAPPKGAPVYYGFPILDDVEVDGFRLGKISDFETESMGAGDSFVVAPDDSLWSSLGGRSSATHAASLGTEFRSLGSLGRPAPIPYEQSRKCPPKSGINRRRA